ncbi:MAG: type II toxin-antitoxin system VapC family toxin [Gemmatimonadetes bacterium]|nr:type II toxin-antitoxin system VapC family toxin [Gemmatimonadota bacterium]
MIFVDTNVFMYAVGKEHALKAQASEFFRASVHNHDQLCTSAEVLQELLHVYLAENRLPTFETAVRLISDLEIEVWPLDDQDVYLAHQMHERFPTIQARDLCHWASCQRRGIGDVKTFDSVFNSILDSKKI